MPTYLFIFKWYRTERTCCFTKKQLSQRRPLVNTNEASVVSVNLMWSSLASRWIQLVCTCKHCILPKLSDFLRPHVWNCVVWLFCSLIADTRQSAAAALNASNAYRSIIDAINRAWNASMEAVSAADEAKAVRQLALYVSINRHKLVERGDEYLSIKLCKKELGHK